MTPGLLTLRHSRNKPWHLVHFVYIICSLFKWKVVIAHINEVDSWPHFPLKILWLTGLQRRLPRRSRFATFTVTATHTLQSYMWSQMGVAFAKGLGCVMGSGRPMKMCETFTTIAYLHTAMAPYEAVQGRRCTHAHRAAATSLSQMWRYTVTLFCTVSRKHW